jgi:ADP-ribose pyrophosphatase
MNEFTEQQLIEQVQQSRRGYDGRLIHVRVDGVTLPNGKVATREIVEHPGAVAIVPLLDDNTVLLVRQYRPAAGQVLWEIPAGTLEPGEDPRDCALREIEEETGHCAGSMTKIYEAFVAPGYCMELMHGFVATQLTAGTTHTDADEFIRVEAVALDEALRMIDRMEIRDAKTICGLLLARHLNPQSAI